MVEMFKNVSHSSYIDMCYMIGVPGCLAVVSLTVLSTVRHACFFLRKRDERALAVALIKLATLACALALSLFPYRYFLMAVILEMGLKHEDPVALQP